jgi:hypothetical protein
MPSNAPPAIPAFSLTHAQARWLLSVLYGGTGRPDMDTAFDAYLKYLRREGLPFAADELGVGRGKRMLYDYSHLMELAVALYLKSQAILPKQVVNVLASLRDKLRPIYERAYLEAESGLGQPVEVQVNGVELVTMGGVSLDLGLQNIGSGDRFSMFANPQALGPAQLIYLFATQNRRHNFRDPVPLSDLAREVVRLAPHAPEARRGRG